VRVNRALAAAALLLAVLLSGCEPDKVVPGVPDKPAADVSAPDNGLCRDLDVDAVAAPSDDTDPVACAKQHTAETFYVGSFDKDATKDTEYDDASLGETVARTCGPRYTRFTGATDSLALRTVVTWAWWRPSEEAWKDGARWFRCDVISRSTAKALAPLPRTTKGLLLGIPNARWMVCADGPKVADAPRVACTEKHTWRAVSAVSVGKKHDPWPGSRLVEVRSRDFCSDWVGAWSNYSLDYEFAYTWFGKDDWASGNRLTVCWARTEE
jgi:hypothetical protein